MEVEYGELGGVGGNDQRDNVRAQEAAATDNEDAAQWLLGLRGNGSHCVCGWGSGLKGSSREVEIWGLFRARE